MSNKELKEQLNRLEEQFKQAQLDLIRVGNKLSLLEEIMKDEQLDVGVTIDLPGEAKKDFKSISFLKING